MNRVRSVILLVGLQIILGMAPLTFGLVYPWAAMTVSGMVFLILFLFPESILRLSQLPKVSVVLFSFVFIYLAAQTVFIPRHSYSIAYELLKWTAVAALVLLIQEIPSKKAVLQLLIVLIFIGMGEALYGFYEVATGHEHVLWHKKESYLGFLTGTYINRNHFAGFLELCLGIHFGFMIRSYFIKRRFPYWVISAILLLLALFQTGSRMGVISFFSALLFCTFFTKSKFKKLYGVVLLFSLSVGIFIFLRGGILPQRFDISGGLKNFDGGRYLLWNNVFVMLKDFGVLGSGLGTFGCVFPAYLSKQFLLGFDHAHQDYLELMTELGVPAFLALSTAMLTLIKSILTGLDTTEQEFYPLVWGALISLLSLLIHGLADFNLAIPANSLLFFLILGAAIRLQRQGDAYA